MQLSILGAYFYFQKSPLILRHSKLGSVTFLNRNSSQISKMKDFTTGEIYLKNVKTKHSYVDFNTSVCFVNGTDLKAMKRSSQNWHCACLPHWHGKDCGQPEVVMRALLAHRKPVSVQGPRIYQRRIIYVFETNEILEDLTEIRINELDGVVDVYVIYDEGNFEKKLSNQLLKRFKDKILLLKSNKNRKTWREVIKFLRGIQNDDIVVTTEHDEIPNKYSLYYFKFYDKWPEPLYFRLRWSVYGFFWIHPSKTMLGGFAATVGYLSDILNNDLTLLNVQNVVKRGKIFIVGDLNHYGGWRCEYCNHPSQIVQALKENHNEGLINWKEMNKKSIDVEFIEDLVENGIYLDGKTNLLRGHRNGDLYYSPLFVEDNSWKYDYLLYNMYAKMDY